MSQLDWKLPSRRAFVGGMATAAVATPWIAAGMAAEGGNQASAVSDPLAGRLYKTLKIGMIGVKGTLEEKFAAAKAAGFEGVELNTPGVDVEAARAASQAAGLPIDGSVCSTHWNIRHTSPEATTRATALEHLQQSLREVHAVGGSTVLLVVGHGNDGPEEEIWKRSIDNIAEAVPLAARLGVMIAIENVWNHFLYTHDGPQDQSAEGFVAYVDELNSPWVGMQFDIGNHWKYGNVGDWIRTLGRRIVKLDVKGFSRASNKFTNIGEGDIDFADVRAALTEINFHGWCAAEVGGGEAERLEEIAGNMDRVFGL